MPRCFCQHWEFKRGKISQNQCEMSNFVVSPSEMKTRCFFSDWEKKKSCTAGKKCCFLWRTRDKWWCIGSSRSHSCTLYHQTPSGTPVVILHQVALLPRCFGMNQSCPLCWVYHKESEACQMKWKDNTGIFRGLSDHSVIMLAEAKVCGSKVSIKLNLCCYWTVLN